MKGYTLMKELTVEQIGSTFSATEDIYLENPNGDINLFSERGVGMTVGACRKLEELLRDGRVYSKD